MTARANKELTQARAYCTDAVALSRRLPDTLFELKADAVKELGKVVIEQKENIEAEALAKERISILERHADEAGPGIGQALFDLESFYGATNQVDNAMATANRAVTFYKACIDKGQEADLCDRRMADVEGIAGSVLFLAGRSDEAVKWLDLVLSRKEESVRPQVMLAALRAYSKILITRGELVRGAVMMQRAVAFERGHPGSSPNPGQTR